VLETMRECLQDVFDVPGLRALLGDLAAGRIRVVEVETPRPSPFASSLLFSYVGAFLYEGDAPLAERRAAALSVDSALLAELLGQAELRELLDPEAIEAVERRVGWLTEERRLRDAEAVADALRVLGPLSDDELTARGGEREWVEQLVSDRRAVSLRLATGQRWVAVEDLARLRDALGVPLPPGVPGAFAAPVPDPVGDLVSRYARTHGPFTTPDAAAALGLGPAVVAGTLDRLSTTGRLVPGAYRPGGSEPEWCDADVLRQIRRASLAIAQRAVEPVPAERLATFLPAWQQVSGQGISGQRSGSGIDDLYHVLEQLAGATAPASEWERSILPARVPGYRPAWLDELTGSGDVVWFGAGGLPQADGWVGFVPADQLPTLLPSPSEAEEATDAHTALLDLFGDGVALLTRGVHSAMTGYTSDVVDSALWDLVWAGVLTNDSLAALRVRLGGRGRQTSPRSVGRRQGRRPGRPAAADGVPGRWFRVSEPSASPTLRAHATAQALLGRHGVLTRGAAAAEGVSGGFAAVYRVMAAMEDAGQVQRGYFVEGLGVAQFAGSTAVDRLRNIEDRAAGVLALAATDPANPYGAALPWPAAPDTHRPGRKAGATVVLDDGGLALFVERGGKSLITWCDSADGRAASAVAALVAAVRTGHRPPLHVHQVDGVPVHTSPWRDVLQQGGLLLTPRGLRLRQDRGRAPAALSPDSSS
jgi:ATP-dependent Lhr-like helicase